MQNQNLYHYCVETELDLALSNNVLSPSGYFLNDGEEPFISSTFSSHWERLVFCLNENKDINFVPTDFSYLVNIEPLFRIQLNPRVAFFGWDNVLTGFRLPAKSKSIVNRQYHSLGFNPKQWRFSSDPISSVHFWGIDCWDNSESEWKPYPGWNPDGSIIYLTDHNEVVHNLTAKTTLLESELDKAKAEVLGVKALAGSKDGRINLLESSNSKLQQQAEEAKKQLRHFLDSHTESALEQKIKKIEEEKKSESLGKELLGEDLEKANKAILEKDRAIDSRDCYVTYLQARLRARGIPFNPHYGHENRLKDVA